MKIAIWIYSLGKGGSERVLVTLANAFARRGHDVIIYEHNSHGSPYKSELDHNVNHHILKKTIPFLGRPRKLVYMITLARILRRERHDILFTTTLNHNVMAALFKKLFRLPVALVIRESNTLSTQTQTARKLSKKRLFFYAKKLYPQADKIIAPSHGVAEDLARHIPALEKPVSVIPNPLNLEEINAKKHEALPENSLLEGRDFIMGAGRLLPQKGFDVLIDAWAKLASDKGIDLLLLGEGEERNKLVQKVEALGLSERLHLPGFDPNPYRYLARASGFVLSSYHEGLPNVLLQALACGCPVVATDCPSGPREILDNGEYGTLVPVGDDDALAKAIAGTLNTESDPEKLINRARGYDYQAIGDEYLACFQDVLDTKRNTL